MTPNQIVFDLDRSRFNGDNATELPKLQIMKRSKQILLSIEAEIAGAGMARSENALNVLDYSNDLGDLRND